MALAPTGLKQSANGWKRPAAALWMSWASCWKPAEPICSWSQRRTFLRTCGPKGRFRSGPRDISGRSPEFQAIPRENRSGAIGLAALDLGGTAFRIQPPLLPHHQTTCRARILPGNPSGAGGRSVSRGRPFAVAQLGCDRTRRGTGRRCRSPSAAARLRPGDPPGSLGAQDIQPGRGGDGSFGRGGPPSVDARGRAARGRVRRQTMSDEELTDEDALVRSLTAYQERSTSAAGGDPIEIAPSNDPSLLERLVRARHAFACSTSSGPKGTERSSQEGVSPRSHSRLQRPGYRKALRWSPARWPASAGFKSCASSGAGGSASSFWQSIRCSGGKSR